MNTNSDEVESSLAYSDSPSLEPVSTPDAALEHRSLVGIRIRNRRGIFTCGAPDFAVDRDMRVYLQTSRGHELGTVSHERLKNEQDRQKELVIHAILRPATDADLDQEKKQLEQALSDRSRCMQRVQQLHLNMRVVKAERLFDGSRIIFYFLAPQKVDFRELVRLLASDFRMRIELRQITSREYVGMSGAIGSCGRKTCCSTFLVKAPSVEMMMADAQKLGRHAGKLNGVCGRLKCCIAYEYDFYREALDGGQSRSSCGGCGSSGGCTTGVRGDNEAHKS